MHVTTHNITIAAVILCAVLPISMSFWLVTLLSSWSYLSADDSDPPSPIRWLLSLLIPISLAVWGFKSNYLDLPGAIAGLFIGFILTLSNYCFLASLLIYFFTSSKITKLRPKVNPNYGSCCEGLLTWIHVVTSCGAATELTFLYLLENGIGEVPIDFRRNYSSSWFAVGVLSALAYANGDSWASGLGPLFMSGDTLLITTLKKVPQGTSGGVSLGTLVFSALGGTAVGLSYYTALLLCFSSEALMECIPQWPLVLLSAFAGFFGSVVDSFLGATLQYSGFDSRTGRVVEYPSSEVEHISGYGLLDNHSVNLISSILTSLSMPRIAMYIWTVLT